MVVLFLIFWGVSLLFAVMAAPVDTLTNSAWGFSPPPHQHLLFVIFFFWLYKHFIYFCLFVIFLTIAFPVGEVVAHCDFSLCFPDDYDIWHLFMCLLAGWMSYSERLPGSQPVRRLERLLLNCPAAWALRVCAAPRRAAAPPTVPCALRKPPRWRCSHVSTVAVFPSPTEASGKKEMLPRLMSKSMLPVFLSL